MSDPAISLPVGRFAPSPSGRMHLGNLLTAVVSWHSAKSRGGRWILRIEDLDPQRSKRSWAEMIEDDLHWLGLEWDYGGLSAPESCQSGRTELYLKALSELKQTGMVYACTCTRADLLAAQAPHQSDGRVVYGGRCRPLTLPSAFREPAQPHALRLAVPDRTICFTDRFCGQQQSNLAVDCGDFLLMRADGAVAYQLAVVVDDALMGVTEVIRGDDLLLSTAQQIYLYELLGYDVPEFAHVPLVRNAEGRRLSKRDKAQSMEALRLAYRPEELLGKIAAMAGLTGSERAITPAELLRLSNRLLEPALTIPGRR